MGLTTDIEQVRVDFAHGLSNVQAGDADAEQLRIDFLGRKGRVAGLFARLGGLPVSERPATGKLLNQLKAEITAALDDLHSRLEGAGPATEAELDLTLPGDPIPRGALHPITLIQEQIKAIFMRLGFSVFYGPEVETEYYNFAALNFKPDHPARDMQDTFYIDDELLLRTHTSNDQIHAMEQLDPPLRILMPGRVFRNEAINARSHCQFHQVEGLVVDHNTSLAELKGTMIHFARELYGPDTVTRFRPSYFPFTEPSAEMDIYWGLESERDHRITKGTGWLEIMGCGMVHPNVLQAGGLDPQEWTGYAFGMGMERMAMLKWGIGDIRYFFEGDLRFLRQF